MSNFTPPHAIVWTEVPVTDLAMAKAFYTAVLQSELTDQEMGPFPTAVFPKSGKDSVAGHLYVGKPASPGTGATVHFAAPTPLEDSLERVKAAGGQVVSDIVEIPDGRFAYCMDPDGNSFGLFA
ncbi:VOC family protein [Mesorhizobium sp. NBSH29]|uniref:VOC family protein n=1 Tax=Mesorhizobium sp. NBSH29 TaxID=2654249 RepID=UPI0018963F3C|nr:VOC family protein [Mesorhizobium sp. NBSH29]QPC88375.1 VOC family protein [Mesorhizobium sp. NBSH29]